METEISYRVIERLVLTIFKRSVQLSVGCLPLLQIKLGQFLLAGVCGGQSVVSVKSWLGNIWVHLYTTNL